MIPVANADFSNVGSFLRDTGSAVEAAHDIAHAGQAYAFFDLNAAPIGVQNNVNRPRIRPVAGSSQSSIAFGTPDNALQLNGGYPEFWQMQQYHNTLYWRWKLTGDRVAYNIMAAQWAYVSDQFSAANMPSGQTPATWGLHSDGSGDGTVNFSDDGGWMCQYLMQVNEAGLDGPGQLALQALVDKIPRLLARFADTGASGRTITPSGGFPFSKYGIFYNTSAYESTPYEVFIMLAALYVYERTSFNGYLQYVEQSWSNWLLPLLKHSSGNYYGSVSLSSLTGTSQNYGYPKCGSTSLYLMGTEVMGVLAARLYRLTRDPQYLAEALSTAVAASQPQDGGVTNNASLTSSAAAAGWGFVGTNNVATSGVFINPDDPWTGSSSAVPYALEVLTLPGADPTGKYAAAAMATSSAIGANLGVFNSQNLTADWGGAARASVPGWSDANGNVTTGLYTGYPSFQACFNVYSANLSTDSDTYAGHQQITTSSNTLSRLQGGLVCERRTRGGRLGRALLAA